MMRPTQQKMGVTIPRMTAMINPDFLDLSKTGLLKEKRNSYINTYFDYNGVSLKSKKLQQG